MASNSLNLERTLLNNNILRNNTVPILRNNMVLILLRNNNTEDRLLDTSHSMVIDKLKKKKEKEGGLFLLMDLDLLYVGHGRIYSSVGAGCLAGALGLENLWGFLLYVALCVVGVDAVVLLSGRKKETHSWSDVTMQSIFSGLFCFCLFWTLTFNLKASFH